MTGNGHLIDTHLHVLPGTDGCTLYAESLKMLRKLSEYGVDEVVLTPNYRAYRETAENFLERRNIAYKKLIKETEASGITGIKLKLGAEIGWYEGLAHLKESILEKFMPEGSSVLMIEMPFKEWDKRIEEELIILSKKAQVVLSSVQRYADIGKNGRLMEELAREGILMQADTCAFTDERLLSSTLGLMRRGLIQFLGSNAKNAEEIEFKEAEDAVKRYFGAGAYRVLADNAAYHYHYGTDAGEPL